jgi:GntR family histidine utilization transcriptional repressor
MAGSNSAVLRDLPRNSPRPLYQQIQDSIIGKISSGQWGPGEKIPSENRLVDDLKVSRMTINRALRELTQRGYLERVHGVGTFVAEPPRHASLIEIQDISEEISESGSCHRAEVLHLKTVVVRGDIAARMELASGSRVFHILVMHYRNEVPIQIEDRYVNPEMAPEFKKTDFAATTPTQYLIGLYRPDEMEHIASAIMPDKKIAGMLKMRLSDPCLRLSRRTWKKGRVVTFVDFTYPGARYELGARYSTSS